MAQDDKSLGPPSIGEAYYSWMCLAMARGYDITTTIANESNHRKKHHSKYPLPFNNRRTHNQITFFGNHWTSALIQLSATTCFWVDLLNFIGAESTKIRFGQTQLNSDEFQMGQTWSNFGRS